VTSPTFPRPTRVLTCRPNSRHSATPNAGDVTYYLDTSALVKLVVAEPRTSALLTWLNASDRRPVSCDLARTELLRAVRLVASDRVVQARAGP
jgi:hypothetical protein